ncbi:hypothetical protein [Candidatus Enterovibrio altilux]|uniref:S1 motif domain-containing protein n=1 Tax=Candidatus Enterovibrio altilux TaxID=1927128 RepID=A0A291B8J1_9GAMM|nr:hypothetical protein [Candidatus Enterovibrio luxaltus]ATF09326.1 hypothetical protein BTN50_0817 [Candidatus Enterovibrio luxaltus]
MITFGACVDIGVYQDGLVHIFDLSDEFILDLREVVKVDEAIKTQSGEHNLIRKYITLSIGFVF